MQTSLSFKSKVSSIVPLTQSRPPLTIAARQELQVEDRVCIRLARCGRKRRPFYRIIAIDSRKANDSRVLQYLGWHDPLKKESSLNAPAIQKWLDVGAKPSQTAGNILKKAMVIE